MTIFDEKEEPVGFIWTLHEHSEDIKQSFLCDFDIYEKDAMRTRGPSPRPQITGRK